ncbi:cell division protein CrgA [Bifidobacterium cebidarum]|uniref:Cell division protein CrgA n=1 Tax=Bifidobacterium cebidarum TaxID=2650773 RepID=A0A6I1GQG8_9BIFI|nr:cell division protein CrgA [Bifidobacterium cebidarum]KAB7788791.1 septation inhibitor protein [Bifidobacterium cebidarum]
MADEELHENDSKDQKDWQNETASADAKATESTDTDANAAADEDETYGVDMDKVQAVLNATADKASLTPQMQRMMNRQAENTKRVEETIKGTKSNPRWFVPVFCAFMIIGLIWCVVYYLSPSGAWPIPNIGAWNLAIGFALIMIGFLMTMGWR